MVVPRIRSGVTSDRYKGAVNEATPTARPSRIRPIHSRVGPWATTQTRAPTTNNADEASSARLRPRALEIEPADRAPTAAPTIIDETTQPSMLEDSENSSRMKGSAPEITPISMPNNSPASAASPQDSQTMGTISAWATAWGGVRPGSDEDEEAVPAMWHSQNVDEFSREAMSNRARALARPGPI